jgi:hypothetical protein
MMMITKSGNGLEVRKQNICIYKDIIYIIMRNVKVMMMIKSIYWMLDNSWEPNYRQALEKENKLI